MKNIIFLALLALAACGTEYETIDGHTEKEFSEYTRQFASACNKNISDITMVFGDATDKENPNRVGYCSISKSLKKGSLGNKVIIEKKIVVDKEYWNSVPSVYRKVLIWHELGHCALDRGHIKKIDEHGHPVSIMHPYISPQMIEAYQSNPKAYTEELCQNPKDQQESIQF